MEIYADLNSITLRKVEDKCIFCGDTRNLISFKEKLICKKCFDALYKEKIED